MGTLLHHFRHVLTLFHAVCQFRVGHHLREAADDVERRAHLVAHILDKGCFHLLRFGSTAIGLLQLLHVFAPGLHDIEEGEDQQAHECEGCRQSDHLGAMVLAVGIVKHKLIADSFHAVYQHDIVYRVFRSRLLFQG